VTTASRVITATFIRHPTLNTASMIPRHRDRFPKIVTTASTNHTQINETRRVPILKWSTPVCQHQIHFHSTTQPAPSIIQQVPEKVHRWNILLVIRLHRHPRTGAAKHFSLAATRHRRGRRGRRGRDVAGVVKTTFCLDFRRSTRISCSPEPIGPNVDLSPRASPPFFR
jgi:hypothetical protein